jgi:hypothetical protein
MSRKSLYQRHVIVIYIFLFIFLKALKTEKKKKKINHSLGGLEGGQTTLMALGRGHPQGP